MGLIEVINWSKTYTICVNYGTVNGSIYFMNLQVHKPFMAIMKWKIPYKTTMWKNEAAKLQEIDLQPLVHLYNRSKLHCLPRCS